MDFSIILKKETPTEIELPTSTITASIIGSDLILEGGIKYAVDTNLDEIADFVSLEIDDANKSYWAWCDYKGDWETDTLHLARNVFTNDYTPIYLKLLSNFSPLTNMTIKVSTRKKIDEC